MDKMRDHLVDSGLPAKTGSVIGIKRLSADAAATTAELRNFVRGLKGRSPQEVMGMVASSALTQAMIVSTIGTIAIISVLTVVPFVFSSPPKAKPSKPTASVSAEPEPTKGNADSKKASTSGTPSEEDIKKASKAMGLDETKTADPKKNPLDKLDNLLDKLE